MIKAGIHIFILFLIFYENSTQLVDETTTNEPLHFCGDPAVMPIQSQLRIVGGVVAKPHSWPWQISLRKNNSGDFIHWCGGSIISRNVILTAAHCFILTRQEVIRNDQFLIVAGDHDQTTDSDGPTQTRKVKKIIINDKYNPFVEPRANDVALVILQESLVFNENITQACLPKEKISKGENCYAIGWGNTKNTGINTLLNQARIPIYDYGTCQNFPGYNYLIDSMICAWNVGGGVSICSGDSGSAYSCKGDDGLWYLQGVTVWSSCTSDYPVLFQRVFSHLQWIQENTGLQVYNPAMPPLTTNDSYVPTSSFYAYFIVLLFIFL